MSYMENKDFIARLVIYGLPDMNARELKSLKKWIDAQIENIKKPKEYSKIFTAKLMK